MPLEKLSESVRGKKDAVSGQEGQGANPGIAEEMPVVPHKVLYHDLPFYTNVECTHEVSNARICILRPLDPDGFDELEVVPTTKRYQSGQYVNWKLNKGNLWEECFYRNPETGQVEQAWTMHVEFVGQLIPEDLIEQDRDRITKLEAQYQDSDAPVN